MRYPGTLDLAVADWLAKHPTNLRHGTAEMAQRYKSGQRSAGLDLAAYVTTRLPATFAANQFVMRDIANLARDVAPKSLLDVGAGPGTASWAALGTWPSIETITQVEIHRAFREQAQFLNANSALPALQNTRHIASDIRDSVLNRADLVVASYVLAEHSEAEIASLTSKLWNATDHVIIVIEPGTPQGFTRIRLARSLLLGAGAHLIGPCTHTKACPIQGGDWCHFKTRVQRSREHMHAKAATVPFEDEPLSWIAASRAPVTTGRGRIVAPVTHSKFDMTMKLCSDGEIQNLSIATRDHDRYKRMKKLDWGQVYQD